MNTFEAIVLGITQGLTEFLPVSSSGHLVLFQHLFGLKEPELLFDICLHVGTLSAVVLVFFRDIVEILRAVIRALFEKKQAGGPSTIVKTDPSIHLAMLIVVGTIPTVVIGLAFRQIAHQLFGSIAVVGGTLLVTGTMLWLTRNIVGNGRPVARTSKKDALIIGIVQGLAIMPGISRSGSTIATAMFLGVDRKVAGRFSFLLSLPAIIGALLLSLNTPELATGIPLGTIVLGSIISALVGWLSLVVLLRIVYRGQLHRFAPYCWVVGTLTLVLAMVG